LFDLNHQDSWLNDGNGNHFPQTRSQLAAFSTKDIIDAY
jgi:hypothetical protein